MASARTGLPARRSSIVTPDRLGRVLALLSLLTVPAQAMAQATPADASSSPASGGANAAPAATQGTPASGRVSGVGRNADQALEDLIPDSALDNPDAWAGDTAAARAPVSVTAIEDLTRPESLADIPEISLAWPDQSELPAIEPLTPDPDIQMAQQQTEQAVEALPGQVDVANGQGPAIGSTPYLADVQASRVGGQVEVAFPGGEGANGFAERQDVLDRFSSLSTLRTLDDNDDNLAQLSRRARSDRDLLLQIMRLYGYYDAEVYQTLGGLDRTREPGAPRSRVDANKVVVRFDVVPGPAYKLAAINLGDIEGTGADYPVLRASFGPKIGDIVNTDKILVGRTDLSTALGEHGYAFAEVGEPDLVIDHDPRTGDLTLPVTSGGKYRFGHAISGLPRFLSSRHFDRIARFKAGDIYRRSQVDDLRQAILATGLVSSVTVTPREVVKPAAGQEGTVDVDVAITKAPLRTIAGLIGYSSGEGVRLEASWEHRNFFPPEGLIRFRGVVGTREQLAGVTFRRNNFRQRDQVLTADLYAQFRRTDAYDARTASFVASIERQTTLIFQKPFIYSAGVEILATGERSRAAQIASLPYTTYFIGALPLRAAFDASDDLLDPTSGFRIGLRASPEISVQAGTRSTYVKAQFDASTYRQVTDKVVLAGRVRLGTIQGTEAANIAPSRRLYAGGAASVRGYGYQNVGPKDSLGNPSGGTALTEFSLEARVKTGLVGGAISVVPFIDAGSVTTSHTPGVRDMKFGAGIGIRYQTNFGPIRIDVGTPINPSKGDNRIGVYVALGQAF